MVVMRKHIFFEVVKNYFSVDELYRIQNTKVLIVGCGGLGSNVANILVRCGFVKFTLVDFDVVEVKNLNRQLFFISQCGVKKVEALKKNLHKVNPQVKVETLCMKVNSKNCLNIIKKVNADVVVEAVDDEKTKKLLFDIVLSSGGKIVCASGIAGYGDCERIKISRGENYSIVGDMNTSVKEKKPLLPKVSAVASIQADEVLRLVLKNE